MKTLFLISLGVLGWGMSTSLAGAAPPEFVQQLQDLMAAARPAAFIPAGAFMSWGRPPTGTRCRSAR